MKLARPAPRGMPPSRTRAIRAKLPAAERAGFDIFVAHVAAVRYLRVVHTTLDELTPAARRALVPFLRLGDGGALACWLAAPRGAPVVHFDSEGGRRVVAHGLADLCVRVARRRSRVHDLDANANAIGLRGSRRPLASLPALEHAFAAFCAAGSALQPPSTAAAGEQLRVRLVEIAKRMLRDGRSRVYTPRSTDWSIDLRAERAGAGWCVTHLDYGAWHRVPASYGLAAVVADVLALAKRRGLRRYEIVITRDGLVSVNRDRDLLLLGRSR